jgi:hypothetical protein
MIEVFNENYFIDLDQIEKYLDMTESVVPNSSGETETKINLVKFEMVKMLLEVVLTEGEIMDEKLGLKQNNVSVPFKLAFNSLLNKKIINYY